MPKTKPQPTKREVALDRQNQELRVALSNVQRLMEDCVGDVASVHAAEAVRAALRVAGEALKTPAAGS